MFAKRLVAAQSCGGESQSKENLPRSPEPVVRQAGGGSGSGSIYGFWSAEHCSAAVFTLAFSLQPSAFAPLVDNRPPV